VSYLPFRCSSFTATATTAIYTLSLHDALPIFLQGDLRAAEGGLERVALKSAQPSAELGDLVDGRVDDKRGSAGLLRGVVALGQRSEEHTSELQSRENLVCRLLLEKKNTE